MWHIQDQIERYGKSEKIVQCKRIRMFPIQDQGQTVGFGRLGFKYLRIIIKSDKDYELQVNCSLARGIDYPVFKIKHNAGFVETYELQREFEARLKALGGDDLKNTIINLFAARIIASATKKAA